MWSSLKYHVIIDGDSVSGREIDALMQSFRDNGIVRITHVVVVGKEESTLQKYKACIPQLAAQADIKCHRVGSYQNEADIVCATEVGYCLHEIVSSGGADEEALAIISHDKLVVSIGKLVQERGVGLIVLDSTRSDRLDYSNPRTKLISLETAASRATAYEDKEQIARPQSWFYSIKEGNHSSTGFVCKQVGQTDYYPAPVFVPFPESMRVFSIGRNADISLAPWDKERGLYSKNVEIEYHPMPDACWSIRSLKGMRRGAKEIKVNGKTLSSDSSDVIIRDGDAVDLGAFSFVLKTDRMNDFLQFEDPKVLFEIIEKSLKHYVEQFPASSIPEYLLDELRDDHGNLSLECAFFRHYRKILKSNWSSQYVEPFRKLYQTKPVFDERFISINDIRNTLFHPSKGALSISQKETLVSFFFELEQIGVLNLTTDDD